MLCNRIFISYSHSDDLFLKRLQVHLQLVEREASIDIWSDKKIRPGDEWSKEIDYALSTACAAILLISADFLASNFIRERELPKLLDAAEKRGTKILQIIVKPCGFTQIPELAKFQAFNDPKKPVINMNTAKREDLWNQVASTIREIISKTNLEDTDSSKIQKVQDIKEFRDASFNTPHTDRLLDWKHNSKYHYNPTPFVENQRVKHKKFGIGTISEIRVEFNNSNMIDVYGIEAVTDIFISVSFDDKQVGEKIIKFQDENLVALDDSI